MFNPLLHEQTRRQILQLCNKPPHALLIYGPSGIGKGTVATYVTETLLELPAGTTEQYPYFQRILPNEKNTIGIENIRQLDHLLNLKVPGKKTIARAVIIEDAQFLTLEAQNALLKQLEEPPTNTVLILTTSHIQSLLPTIRSRTQTISVQKPPNQDLLKYFAGTVEDIKLKQLSMISGGLPGLLASLIDGANDHPLRRAVDTARSILQGSVFDRLLMVDELSKHKILSSDICYVLSQMADVALASSKGTSFKRWQIILKASFFAHEQLIANVQPKLVLTRLMLEL